MTKNLTGTATQEAPECACGCPADVHVGEIGCPCGLPDEPPCAIPCACDLHPRVTPPTLAAASSPAAPEPCKRHYYAIDGTCQRCGADSAADRTPQAAPTRDDSEETDRG